MTEPTVHLMIPRFHPGGYAEYACNPDGSRDLGPTPMRQRTLHPAKATCPDCLAVAHDRALADVFGGVPSGGAA